MATHLKDTARKRTNRLFFDLSNEELEQLNNRLKNFPSKNRSQFIRQSVLNDYIIINDDTNLRKLVFEVNQIGTNINQMAHLANQNKKIEEEEIEELQKQIKEIRSLVFHSLMKHNEKR